LKVGANGKFKILQLTDLHLGEDTDRDAQTVNTVSTIIGREMPDFVVITGDLVSGQVNSLRRGSFFYDSAQPLLSLFENFHLPWSLVPGYYDHINGMVDEVIGRVTGSFKMNSYQANDFQLFGDYLSNGFTYYLPIGSAEDSTKELARLWFFGTDGNF